MQLLTNDDCALVLREREGETRQHFISVDLQLQLQPQESGNIVRYISDIRNITESETE